MHWYATHIHFEYRNCKCICISACVLCVIVVRGVCVTFSLWLLQVLRTRGTSAVATTCLSWTLTQSVVYMCACLLINLSSLLNKRNVWKEVNKFEIGKLHLRCQATRVEVKCEVATEGGGCHVIVELCWKDIFLFAAQANVL